MCNQLTDGRKERSVLWVTTEYTLSRVEMKYGECICRLSWSVHCNFVRDVDGGIDSLELNPWPLKRLRIRAHVCQLLFFIMSSALSSTPPPPLSYRALLAEGTVCRGADYIFSFDSQQDRSVLALFNNTAPTSILHCPLPSCWFSKQYLKGSSSTL